MKNWSKRKKIIALACSVAVICVLSVSAMFATGVLPTQTMGATKSCFYCKRDFQYSSFEVLEIGEPNYCPECEKVFFPNGGY